MSIPSQLPQFVTAARPGALQALALQSGQVLDAKIVGAAANGITQVEIRGQLLNLVLPTPAKPGDSIKLEVQGTGAQLRLALLAVGTVPTSSARPVPAPLAPQPNVPQSQSTIVTLTPLPAGTSPTPPAIAAQPAPVGPSAPQAAAPPAAPAVVPQPTGTATPLVAPGQPAPPQGAPPPAAGGTPVAAPAVVPQTATTPPAQPAVTASLPPAQATVPVPVATYPQAPALALPNPVAAAAAATATVPARPAAPQAVAGAVRPVVATTVIANATAHSSPGNTTPQAAPLQAATPQSALAQMVQVSVPRQGSITALTTALSGLAGRVVVLPEPVVRAAQQVLAGRVAIDGPHFDGNALQAAVRGSGVFQEANLARGQPLLQPNMKSALLTLRQTLTSWLGQQAPVAPVSQIPPPLRGSIPRARGNEAPPLDPDAAPEEIGKHLLERTESALARVRLHQHASLPDQAGRAADLSMDLPVMVGTQQALMQLQIHRDQHNETETSGERGWQMRFALSLPDMGEVGAQVSLRSGSLGVMLWATEPAASAALDAEITSLREDLTNAGLQANAVLVRHGEPPPAPAAPSGHFVDSRT